ncbi:MAG: 50S ribosomal protein L17 [Anaerolineae bacterium]|jgi:large subunit ribosomal protein L17
MRHRVAGRKLGRDTSQRKALYRSLMTELFRHGRIRTTLAKARAVQGEAEKIVTKAKVGLVKKENGQQDVAERRQVAGILYDKAVVRKLFDEIAPTVANRRGGYTRVVKLGPRKGDAAEMAILELVDGAE